MIKIATHNSGTGERSKGWLSRLLVPFARCQSKTLLGQYKHGCRLFDIRVNNKGRLAHGLWESEKDAFTALRELNDVSNGETYVLLTIEGDFDQSIYNDFGIWKTVFTRLRFIAFCAKKPVWTTTVTFIPIEWRKEFSSATWRKWIPLPMLWARLAGMPVFDNKVFTMVDDL